MKTYHYASSLCLLLCALYTQALSAEKPTAAQQALDLPAEACQYLANCQSIAIAGVSIDPSEAAQKKVSKKELATCSKYLESEYREVLGELGCLAPDDDSATLRLEFTLLDVSSAKPVLSSVGHLSPIGLVSNLCREGTDKKGTAMGYVTYECRILEASSGRVLADFIVSKTPEAMNLGASVSTEKTLQVSIHEGAQDFEQALIAARKTTQG